MTDTKIKAQGAKGDDAIAPQVQINATTNEWEISTDGGKNWKSTGIKATGEKGDRGDAVFAENGVDYTSDPDNVIFTLADGKTKLTVPRTKILSVKFKDGCDIFSVTSVSNTIDIEFIGLTTENYKALVAELRSEDGTTDIEIVPRAENKDVEIKEPVFTDGKCTGTTVKINKKGISGRLERSFKILKGEGKITEINVAETLKDVRRALLEADVNFKVAKQFTDDVKAKALGQNVINAIKPGELMVKIVHDELARLMGGETASVNLSGNPTVILMSGLQGSGKTTFSGKLARKFKSEQSRRPLLVACDVYRPAAIDQLKVLAEQINVPVYTEDGNKNPVEIAENAIRYAKTNHLDLVIIDTAGRLAVDEQMMQEIAAIKKAVKPQETLFVVDSMTGQDAVNTAKEFNDRLDFDGVVLTKLDGDTRGGAALSIRTVVTKPIKFVGTGEKLDAVDLFHPSRMADRILGMGDIVSLVEKAQNAYDEKQARELQRKIAKNQFNFNDFLQQIRQIQKMGNLKELASMIPGVGKALKDVEIDDNAFKGIEAIISSMTEEERQHPEIINGSRRKRIARGSGTDIQEVNRLIKQFDEARKMMKQVAGIKNPMAMMRGMRGMRR